MNPPTIRRPWERHRTITPIIGESLTHQSHAETCDINHIIRRYDNTGLLPDGNGPGQFGDVTEYQTGDTAGLILKSRETLDTAGQEMSDRKKRKIKAEKDRIAALEAENEKLKAAQTPPPLPQPLQRTLKLAPMGAETCFCAHGCPTSEARQWGSQPP